MRDLTEKTITTEKIYEGKIISVQVDQVKLPNGERGKRELVKHPGAVGVIAITPDNKLVLVRQFRKPLEKTILEIPAGKLEPDEDPQTCAFRELAEETGYQADSMNHVVSYYTSPGFANEIIHLYEAKGLTTGSMQPDSDEFVELVELSLSECNERIASGEICDAKTVTAVYLWQMREWKDR
ncbi:NUDIX hydrolase [Thermoflavimicrobium daqui]|jgi:ADP-ribose pyrophosphatase|uniref:ADP-ribose pyrophosphatase n=1 Tax=Thermoflavimicrobium daqui TaxID=2137476 RepID=A0A364K8A8_9BACL|nr:NUDIX hydrolase [Thermoflavimicrobium daqui]RAL26535.1 ADP-ribose pyrophosphatase [Thermoflavimicrobium daqui]